MNACIYIENQQPLSHVRGRKSRNPKSNDDQDGSKKIFLPHLPILKHETWFLAGTFDSAHQHPLQDFSRCERLSYPILHAI